MGPPEGFPAEQIEKALDDTIDTYVQDYDYILLDAQAGADEYALLATERAGRIVLVSEYDRISSLGIARLKQLFPENFPPDRTWILYNKILSDFASSIGEFLSIAQYLSPIHWDEDVVRAFARGRLAANMKQPNQFTLAVVDTLLSLLGREIEEDIESWKLGMEESIRASARALLDELDGKLVEAQTLKDHLEKEMEKGAQRRRVVAYSAASAAVYTVVGATIAAIWANPTITLLVGTVGIGSTAALVASWLQVSRLNAKGFEMNQIDLYRLELEIDDLKLQRQKLRVRAETSLSGRNQEFSEDSPPDSRP